MLKRTLIIGILAISFTSIASANEYIPPAHYQDPIKEFNFVNEVSHNTGTAWAQYKLGKYYETGFGTKKDIIKAYVWYKLSSAHHFKSADAALENIKAQMSAEQINEANKEVTQMQNKLAMDSLNRIRNYNLQQR